MDGLVFRDFAGVWGGGAGAALLPGGSTRGLVLERGGEGTLVRWGGGG